MHVFLVVYLTVRSRQYRGEQEGVPVLELSDARPADVRGQSPQQ